MGQIRFSYFGNPVTSSATAKGRARAGKRREVLLSMCRNDLIAELFGEAAIGRQTGAKKPAWYGRADTPALAQRRGWFN
jgi:hypothetical protein